MVVEAKGRAVVDTTWATQLRANLIEGERLSEATPFLLVTQAALYFWNGGAPSSEMPSIESAKNGLAPYLSRAGIATREWIDPDVLELFVAAWLRDLSEGATKLDESLAGSALPALLVGARIVSPAAA